jgi:hypothetical protein
MSSLNKNAAFLPACTIGTPRYGIRARVVAGELGSLSRESCATLRRYNAGADGVARHSYPGRLAEDNVLIFWTERARLRQIRALPAGSVTRKQFLVPRQ